MGQWPARLLRSVIHIELLPPVCPMSVQLCQLLLIHQISFCLGLIGEAVVSCMAAGHGSSLFRANQNENAPRLVKRLEGVKVQSAAGGLMNSGVLGDQQAELILITMIQDRTAGL